MAALGQKGQSGDGDTSRETLRWSRKRRVGAGTEGTAAERSWQIQGLLAVEGTDQRWTGVEVKMAERGRESYRSSPSPGSSVV